MNNDWSILCARLSFWFSRLMAMTTKELIQFGRDILLLFAIVYLFVFDTYMAGNVTMQLNKAIVTVHDADHSAASRELIYRFRPPYFKLGGEVLDNYAGQRLLDQGRALVVLNIPSDFAHDITKGKSVDVQVQVDASNTVLGFLASSYTTQIIGQYSYDQALARLGVNEQALENVPTVRNEYRVWYNPNQKDAWFMPISELLVVITIMGIMLPAAAAVREKERGTIEQLMVSPLTPIQILLSKVIAMTLVILLGTAVSLFLVLHGIFAVPMKGSLVLFFAVTTLYIFTTAGLGLYIATLSRNLAQAGPARNSRVDADDLSFRRLDSTGGHAHGAASGHVYFAALLLYRNGLRDTAQGRWPRYLVGLAVGFGLDWGPDLWIRSMAISAAV